MASRYFSLCAAGALLLPALCVSAQSTNTAPPNRPAGFTVTPPHVNAPLGNIQRFPGDGDGAYKTHRYRDLFAEQGHTPAETKAKIDKAFHQLFYGDGQEERVYFET